MSTTRMASRKSEIANATARVRRPCQDWRWCSLPSRSRAARRSLAAASSPRPSMRPTARVQPSPEWPSVRWQLALGRTSAARIVDSMRIAVRPTPNECRSTRARSGPSSPGDMLEDAVLRALEDSGRIADVARQGSGIGADYQLLLDVRRFESDYAGARHAAGHDRGHRQAAARPGPAGRAAHAPSCRRSRRATTAVPDVVDGVRAGADGDQRRHRRLDADHRRTARAHAHRSAVTRGSQLRHAVDGVARASAHRGSPSSAALRHSSGFDAGAYRWADPPERQVDALADRLAPCAATHAVVPLRAPAHHQQAAVRQLDRQFCVGCRRCLSTKRRVAPRLTRQSPAPAPVRARLSLCQPMQSRPSR